MPIGLVIMNWNEKMGTDVKAKYPTDVEIKSSTLMQIFSQHEFTGEPGIVSFISSGLNVISYYTGIENQYYCVLLLNGDEDPDIYEEGLADVARQIMLNLENEAYKRIMSSLYQRLSLYAKLNPEQRLAVLYQSEIKRMVIYCLRDEAVITKAELVIWLKDKYPKGFFDIEAILIELIKSGLIKVSSVKGISSEIVFMVRDIMVSRIPPTLLLDDIQNRGLPSSLKKNFKKEVNNFFAEYIPSEEDSIKIINQIILDPQVYEAFKLLRIAAVTRDDLEKLKKKGVNNIDQVLKVLWDNKIITVYQDKNSIEYYALNCDFFIESFYPEYLIDVVRTSYLQKTQNNNVLVKEMEFLKEEFNIRSKAKISKSKKRSTKELAAT